MKKRGPWKVTGTKTVYKNPWMKIKEDKVIRPDGKSGVYGVVYLDPGVSVLAKEGNRVYLTKEYHYAIESTTIEAVSGAIDKNESRIQAAKRELKEEAGFLAKKWTYLGVVDPLTSIVFSPNHMYLAQGLTKVENKREGTETMEIIKIPFSKAVKWAMEDKITHAASVVLILKASNYLK